MTSPVSPDTASRAGDLSRRKIVAIINPVSCALGACGMREDLERSLARYGASAEYLETSQSELGLPLAAEAVERGATLLLAVGGDGTVMETINGVIGRGISVGIIPAGTGNLLAANLGIPVALDAAVDVAFNGEPKLFDLVSVDGGRKYFSVMGGMGYDGEIMRTTPREVKQKLGKMAYLLTGVQKSRGKRFHVRLTLDDNRTIRAHAKSLLIANMGSFGGHLSLFPNSDPTDGVMEVGILKASSWPTFLLLMWHMLRGKPSESPDFDLYRVRKVVVHSRKTVPLELDGDDMGDVRYLTAEVAPHAACIMVPKSV